MSTVTVKMIDMAGTKYTVTVPRNGTVQDLIDAIGLKTWYKYHVRGLWPKGGHSFLKPEQTLSTLPNLEQTELVVMPDMRPREAMNPNNWRAARQSLGNYFQNVNRRTRGAMYRNYLNRLELMEDVEAALPSNLLRYHVGPFLEGGKRKTRKSRTSRKQTRRRR